MTLLMTLDKIRWRQEHDRQGHERNFMSPELSQALRNEIRVALEANGGPFDINVARRVYDLAIAARDMCVAATGSVKEAIDQVKDTEGPMESLDTSDTPASAVQASESFGARLLRELMASLSLFQQPRGDDPKQLVHALAEARRTGMHDVAEQIEVKLFGSVLSGPRPVIDEVAEGSFEHGFTDGRVGALPATEDGEYHAGYLRGTEARYLRREPSGAEEQVEIDPRSQSFAAKGAAAAIATYGEESVPSRAGGAKFPRPPSGMENAFDKSRDDDYVLRWAEQNACKVCGNQPDAGGTIEHGRGGYVVCENGGGTSVVEFVELPTTSGGRP